MADALDLMLFGDSDGAELIQAQAPIQRPAPIPRPEPIPSPAPQVGGRVQRFAPPQPMSPPQAAPAPAAQAGAPVAPPVQSAPDGLDALLGFDKPATTAPASRAGPFEGYKDPKTEGWGEWLGKNITGRQDPRYKGVPSFEDAMLAEGNEDALRRVRGAAPFVTSDTGMANIAKSSLGKRFVRIETDAYDYPVLVYRSADGKEAKAYINKPGLDTEDVARGVLQGIPYVLTGGLAGVGMKGAGVALNAFAQSGAAGATSILGDVAGGVMGSGEAPDAKKAGIVAGIAGAVPIVGAATSPLIRRFITEPGLYNKSAGTLTPKGEAAAKAAGIDPATLTTDLARDFAKEYAKTGDAAIAGRSVSTREFDIPVTRGQLSKDPAQLLSEKGMRYNVYGESAKDTIQAFDRTQADKIGAAALGGADAKKSVGYVISPDRGGTRPRPADIGESLKTGLQEAQAAAQAGDRAAWKNVGPMYPDEAALQELPQVISSKIGPLRVDDKLTPKAYAMAEDLDRFIAGTIPGGGPSVLRQGAVQEIGDMRKRLLAIYRGAGDKTDVAASKAIYDGFNEWIETSAQKSLMAGDALSAGAMRAARDVTREMHSVFGQTASNGATTPGRRLMQQILNEDATPETIMSGLFSTNPGATPKAATQEALTLIKTGLDRYLPPERAAAVWNDLRYARWQNLVQDAAGNLHTPTMMAKNIDQALTAQQSVMRQLYKPDEINLMRRFSAAMKDVSYKDPNPSGSGTAMAFYGGQWGKALMLALGNPSGPLARLASAMLGWSGVKNAVGSVAASAAIRPVPVYGQSSLPAIAGGIAARRFQDQ